jgi:hypothetical protein
MKILKSFLLMIITIALINSVTSASTTQNQKRSISKSSIENLLEGVSSDNLGLKLSAAYYLGEYECSEAVIPLLNILKNSEREEARITAALALFKINDARGMFAVKQAIKFDKSDRVKKVCSNLYREYLKPQNQNESYFAY